MNKTVLSLKEQAAALGGISLAPKSRLATEQAESNNNREGVKVKKVISLAFTFRERQAAERLLDWTRNAGITAALKSTYHAVLVTAQVSL